MTRWNQKVVVLAGLAGAFGCSREEPSGPPFRARIVVPSGVDGKYKLEDVTFDTLTSLNPLEGTVAAMVGGAVVDVSRVAEVVTGDSSQIFFDSGSGLKVDYTLDGDVVVPANFDSMVALGAYYYYERVFGYWRDNLGLSLDRFERANLYFAPQIEARSEGGSVSITIKVNAAFLTGARDFLLFRTSRLEQLPLSLNHYVLGHEFGHGIFDLEFANKDPMFYEDAADDASFELSAENEGIADFFGYMVTGSASQIQDSLPIIKDARALPVAWTYSTLGKVDPCDAATVEGNFYCKGSVLASALYEASKASGMSAVTVGQHVVLALQNYREDWKAHRGESKFDTQYLLNRIIAEGNATERSVYCTVFRKWFDKSPVQEALECN